MSENTQKMQANYDNQLFLILPGLICYKFICYFRIFRFIAEKAAANNAKLLRRFFLGSQEFESIDFLVNNLIYWFNFFEFKFK